MGYQIHQKLLNLVFGADEEEYSGMEVSLKSLRTGEFLKVTRGAARMSALGSAMGENADLATVNKAIDGVSELFIILGRSLVKWNLEDEGEEIPCVLAQCVESKKPVRIIGNQRCSQHLDSEQFAECDIEGLMGLDMTIVLRVINAWVEAIGGIEAPLPNASENGRTFPEVHIPMDLSSGNQTS